MRFAPGIGSCWSLLHGIEDPSTSITATAERAFVEGMGGGCKVPISAYGALENNALVMVAMAASEDGDRMIKERMSLSPDDPRAAGRALADRASRRRSRGNTTGR